MSDLHPVSHKKSAVYHFLIGLLYLGAVGYHFLGARSHFLEHKREK